MNHALHFCQPQLFRFGKQIAKQCLYPGIYKNFLTFRQAIIGWFKLIEKKAKLGQLKLGKFNGMKAVKVFLDSIADKKTEAA